MKYLLIFVLYHGSPTVLTVNSDVACNQGVQVLEHIYTGSKGVCLPTDGDEHSYAIYLHNANPDMPGD